MGLSFGDITGYVGTGVGYLYGGPVGAAAGSKIGNAIGGGGGTDPVSGLMGGGAVSTAGADTYMANPDMFQWGSAPYRNPDGTTTNYGQMLGRSLDDETRFNAQAQAAHDQGLQARGLQGQAAQSYQGVLAGTEPSLAQQQMARGQADAAAMGNQMAASARGGNAALAARAAQNAQSDASIRAASDNSMLRAREVDMARQGLAGVGGQMRAGDMAQQGLSAQRSAFHNQAFRDTVQQQNDMRMGLASHYQQGQQAANEQSFKARNDAEERKSKGMAGIMSTGGGLAMAYGK